MSNFKPQTHLDCEEINPRRPAATTKISWVKQFIDLEEYPPDENLVDEFDARQLIELHAIPWRQFGNRMIIAVGNLESSNSLRFLSDNKNNLTVVNADPVLVRYFLEKYCAEDLIYAAQNMCPSDYSCRNFRISFARLWFLFAAITALLSAAYFPDLLILTLVTSIILANLSFTLLRIVALSNWRKDIVPPEWLTNSPAGLSLFQPSLKVSILVPLFRETEVLPRLINALNSLNYPKELLEVKFLLEQIDEETIDAIQKIKLPDFIECIVIPKDWLQTKPKAMNYALPFCSGDIIGIYDAEDRPDSDQITKVVNHFTLASANVACVQGYLDFYNSRSNWIARCFTIEYATWFRVILKGLQSAKLPIPLGGTTLFFRKSVLEELGGWDAHNVTEDADLGMRLARFGYRTEMVATTTWEEANNVPLAWVRQRSRWLKGFAITWWTHMRHPARLYNDLGPFGFASFQVTLLGGLVAFASAPLLWILWLSHITDFTNYLDVIPNPLWWVFTVIMVSGQLVTLTAITLALSQQHLRHLFPYILALPLYWPLATLASYKAFAELVFAPFYWDKTTHGRTDDN